MAQMGPIEVFFRLIQTLPTFWAERIWILRTCFLICWTPNFWMFRSPDLQIPRFPGPQISKFPDFQVPRLPDAAGAAELGRILRSQPDPSPNAPRDQIRRKGVLLRCFQENKATEILRRLPNMSQKGLGGFVPTNPDLANILGRIDLDFENIHFLDFWDLAWLFV